LAWRLALKTRTKIALARVASGALLAARRAVGRGRVTTVVRRGLRWELDLAEGVDLAVYLQGAFEPETRRALSRLVRPGDQVVDVGANVGAQTLPLARLVGPSGRVVAVEPTASAFAKLRRNLALNAELEARVTAFHGWLGSGEAAAPPAAYSSWPLVRQDGLHRQHLGRLESTDGAVATTLDALVAAQALPRVDLIKVDVDGAEPEVLAGGRVLLERHRPVLYLEFAPYLHRDHPERFDAMLGLLERLGYVCRDADTDRPYPADWLGVMELIGDGSSRNVIAQLSAASPPGRA
jgi:FkbM family methyltransferase